MGSSSPLLQFGPIGITATVVTTWAVMLLLSLAAWLITRRLRVERLGLFQSAAEGVVLTIRKAIDDVVPDRSAQLLPFVGTLWLFIAVANLAGVLPGVQSPTGNLSTTSALALIVFLSVHWFGIRTDGLRGYMRHYLSPSPILLPFHLISELTRTVALAMRLFGNIMSLEMAALLVLLVAGFLVPLPLLMLHIVEALVLALVYIGGALQVREPHVESQKGDNAS
jgi:F-type H+-transporting ATPase subunit a